MYILFCSLIIFFYIIEGPRFYRVSSTKLKIPKLHGTYLTTSKGIIMIHIELLNDIRI